MLMVKKRALKALPLLLGILIAAISYFFFVTFRKHIFLLSWINSLIYLTIALLALYIRYREIALEKGTSKVNEETNKRIRQKYPYNGNTVTFLFLIGAIGVFTFFINPAYLPEKIFLYLFQYTNIIYFVFELMLISFILAKLVFPRDSRTFGFPLYVSASALLLGLGLFSPYLKDPDYLGKQFLILLDNQYLNKIAEWEYLVPLFRDNALICGFTVILAVFAFWLLRFNCLFKNRIDLFVLRLIFLFLFIPIVQAVNNIQLSISQDAVTGEFYRGLQVVALIFNSMIIYFLGEHYFLVLRGRSTPTGWIADKFNTFWQVTKTRVILILIVAVLFGNMVYQSITSEAYRVLWTGLATAFLLLLISMYLFTPIFKHYFGTCQQKGEQSREEPTSEATGQSAD